MKYRILAAAGALALAGLALVHPARPAAPAIDSPAPSPSARPRMLPRREAANGGVVYVVGAVNRPGLYHIAAMARADDAVRSAGGLRGDADPAGVNLAAYARDGDEIIVPVLGQSISSVVKHRVRAKARSSKASSAVVVDVNTADAATLASVPGIGMAIAERIVAVRERDGAYESIDQLLDVAGMTQNRLDRAEPYLRI